MFKISSLKNIAFTGCVLAFTACTPTPDPHFKVGKPYVIENQQYIPGIDPRYSEIGIASWYGDEFHKGLTANGELFDKNLITAAHKTLPLPSIVKVTNLENGKSMKIRVNDRGPFVKGRIIDLSEAAAKELGFYEKGKAKVLVELDKNASIASLNSVRIKPEDREILVSSYAGPYVAKTKIATNEIIQNTVPEIEKYYNADYNKVIEAREAKALKEKQQRIKDSNEPKSLRFAKIKDLSSKASRTNKPGQVDNSEPVIQVAKTVEVKKEVTLLEPDNKKTLPSNDGLDNFKIQIASFSDLENANEFSSNIASSVVEETNINGKNFYRVKFGSYKNKNDASKELNKLKNKGYNDAFIVAEK
jgi:rare lipoprotein A (peptidoglycan hydrolase)